MNLLSTIINILHTFQADTVLLNILLAALIPHITDVVYKYFSELWTTLLRRSLFSTLFYREVAEVQVEGGRNAAGVNRLIDSEGLIDMTLAYVGYLAKLATMNDSASVWRDVDLVESNIEPQAAVSNGKHNTREEKSSEETSSLPYLLPELKSIRHAAFQYAPITKHTIGTDFMNCVPEVNAKFRVSSASLACHLADNYCLSLVPAPDRPLEVEPGLFIRYTHTVQDSKQEEPERQQENNPECYPAADGHMGSPQSELEKIVLGDLLHKMNSAAPRGGDRSAPESGNNGKEFRPSHGMEFLDDDDDASNGGNRSSRSNNSPNEDSNGQDGKHKEGREVPRQVTLYCRELVGWKETGDYLSKFRRRFRMGLEGVVGRDLGKAELSNPLKPQHRIDAFLRRARLWYRSQTSQPSRNVFFLVYPVLTEAEAGPAGYLNRMEDDQQTDLEKKMEEGSNNNSSESDGMTRLSVRRYPFPSEGMHGKTFSSLFFSQKAAVLRVLEDFTRRSGRFGVPGASRHLNFLVHGPPGTGKTSLVKAMARHLKRHLVVLQLSNFRTMSLLRMWMDYLVVKCSGEKTVMYHESTNNSFTDSVGMSWEKFITLNPKEVIYLIEDADATHRRNPLFRRRTQNASSAAWVGSSRASSLEALSGFKDEGIESRTPAQLRETTSFYDVEVSRGDDAATGESERLRVERSVGDEGPTRGVVWDSQCGALDANSVLSVLKGVATPAERIVVITTNHPDRLDQGLLQSGVVTLDVHMDELDYQQAIQMIQHYFQDHLLTVQEVENIRSALHCLHGRKPKSDDAAKAAENRADAPLCETHAPEHRINPSFLEQICAECDSVSELIEYLGSGRLDFYDHLF